MHGNACDTAGNNIKIQRDIQQEHCKWVEAVEEREWGSRETHSCKEQEKKMYICTFTAIDEVESKNTASIWTEYTAGEPAAAQAWRCSEIQQQMSKRQIFTAAGDTRKL